MVFRDCCDLAGSIFYPYLFNIENFKYFNFIILQLSKFESDELCYQEGIKAG